ncbi:MAG: hypothetical protein QM765_24340 [Myxococcales bacterium]
MREHALAAQQVARDDGVFAQGRAGVRAGAHDDEDRAARERHGRGRPPALEGQGGEREEQGGHEADGDAQPHEHADHAHGRVAAAPALRVAHGA